MTENKIKETRAKGDVFRIAEFSRRQFLKRTGIAAASALITSIAMTIACKTRAITTGTPTDSNTSTEGLDTSNSPASSSVISSSNPVDSISTLTTSTAPASVSTKPATGAPVISGYSYVSPTVLPPLLPITGTTCTVAADRQYSTDNIWVKSLSDTIVVMGITTTMVEILYNPYNLSLLQVGSSVAGDDAFGSIEGFKMSGDLITPVSGKVIQINDALISLAKQGMPIDPIINDPYNSGWMMVVQLSNSSELSNLVTPQKYIELVTKKY